MQIVLAHAALQVVRAQMASGGAEAPADPDLRRQRQLADGLLEALPSFEAIESLLFDRAVEHCGGNVSAVARLLKMRRGQVDDRLRKRAHGSP